MHTTVPISVVRRPLIAVVGLSLALAACAKGASGKVDQPKPPAAPQAATPGATPAAGAAAKPAAPKALIATSGDGTKIAYERTGSGPALLLLHGGGQTRSAWNESGYVERLSKRFTVITMDQRGTGDSDKPVTLEGYGLDRVLADILAVADAAGAQKFYVWGYGHGASIARYLAARSDRVISAVLVATTLGPAVTGIVKDAIVAMRTKWQPLMDARREGKLDMSKLSAGDRSALEGGTPIAALSLGAMLDYPPLEPPEIKARTLWVVGGADTAAMENVKAYEGKLEGTNVTLKVLSSASYSDCFIKTDEVLGAIDPFLGTAAK